MVLKKGRSRKATWAFRPIHDVKAYVGELQPTRKIHTVVVHHTGDDTRFVGIDSWFKIDAWHKRRGWLGVGYHFGITPEGIVWALRPISLIGAHCENHNTGTVGIVVWGNHNKTRPQLLKLAEFLALLQKKFGWVIRFHWDFKSTACPSIDKEELSKLLKIFGGELK